MGTKSLQQGQEEVSLSIARAWCAAKGDDWSIIDQAGRGGTAPVYGVQSPEGELALKIYDAEFSRGDKGVIEDRRIEQQKKLGRHGFPGMVEVYDGGRFQDRIFLLMNRAPGQELEKRLADVPRDKIRSIVDQVARATIFLRDRGLCHRDIKSANVFITDDFEHATVLDLSVMREITDRVGIGTDQGDRLPVVATARYSPPDYLFRLLDPGPEAWHALDIYQLGGLLHDLIMREPLFEQEYQSAKDNRYRFAWTVATIEPRIVAEDVDRDLMALARRALDKDWRRRSTLTLDDFLNERAVRQRRSLGLLGMRTATATGTEPSPAVIRERLGNVAADVRNEVVQRLREDGVTASHDVDWLDDQICVVTFDWLTQKTVGDPVRLQVSLRHILAAAGSSVVPSVALAYEGAEHGVDLPAASWENGSGQSIADGIMHVLGGLAERFMSADRTGI